MRPHIERFEVPEEPTTTVLDGLRFVQDKLDGSLAFRSSCRSGVCGACAVRLNGTPRLACESHLSRLKKGAVRVEPLTPFPVEKDLAVDLTSFWENYRRIRPYLAPTAGAPSRERLQTAAQRGRLEGLVECILCGACDAGAAKAPGELLIPGPAALLAAARFVRDSRDGTAGERLMSLDEAAGLGRLRRSLPSLWLWRPHLRRGSICPKGLAPESAAAELRRLRSGSPRRRAPEER